MIVPKVQCNFCRCHIDSDGIKLMGGVGLLQVFKPPQEKRFQIAEYPFDNDARIHLCSSCLNAIKNLKIADQE